MKQRLSPGEGGASAVEFAFILPLLLLLIFGIITFGLVFNRTQGLQAGAREASRLASINADLGAVRDRARSSASPFFADADIMVTVTAINGSGTETVISSDSHRVCSQVSGTDRVRVELEVDAAGYPIPMPVPIFGDWPREYRGQGVYSCERSS